MKKKYNFSLSTVENVKSFVGLTSRIDGNIAIISGRWVIDGKSIMGIFSLDLTKELSCEIEAEEEQIKIFEEGLRNLKLL